VARAQVAEALVLASGAKTAVAEYRSTTGEWPLNKEAAGLAAKGDISGKYVEALYVEVWELTDLMMLHVLIKKNASSRICQVRT